MKKNLLAIVFLAFAGVASAQQQPNFLFYQQNMSTINPAYAGTQGRFVGLNYRSAWQGIKMRLELQLWFTTLLSRTTLLGVLLILLTVFMWRTKG